MVCFAMVGLANLAAAQTNLAAALPQGFLPKLGAIKLDGDLSEWNVAVTVPIRFQSCTGSHGTELNDLKWFVEFIHRHWQTGK